MPNVILPNLGIELPDVGSDQDTWGDILNADLQKLDNAVQYDVISKTLAGVDVTLTDVEAASAVINLSGTLTANVNVIVPATPVRVYLVRNQTSGAFTVTVKTSAGTGTPVQQGTSSLVYSDGTNIIQGATSVNGSFAVSGALSAGSLTVTGATTLNGNVTLGDAAGDAITVTGTATFAQAAQFPDGTAALPSITNTGDTNTGRFYPAEDTIAESIGGLEALRISSAQNLLVGTTTDVGARLHAVSTNEPARFAATSPSSMFVGFYYDTNTLSGFVGNGNGIVTGSGANNFGIRAENSLLFAAGGATERARITSAGQLLVGITTASTGAFAEFTSTTGALIVPRMTTAQRDAMGAVANGAIIYNTTTNKMNFRENGAWVQPTVTAA